MLLVDAAVSTAVVRLRVVVSNLSRNMLLHNRRGNLSGVGGVSARKVAVMSMVRNRFHSRLSRETYEVSKVFSFPTVLLPSRLESTRGSALLSMSDL